MEEDCPVSCIVPDLHCQVQNANCMVGHVG